MIAPQVEQGGASSSGVLSAGKSSSLASANILLMSTSGYGNFVAIHRKM